MKYWDREDYWFRHRNMVMLLTYMLHNVFTLTGEPGVLHYPVTAGMSRIRRDHIDALKH